jgi:hypothetical protein
MLRQIIFHHRSCCDRWLLDRRNKISLNYGIDTYWVSHKNGRLHFRAPGGQQYISKKDMITYFKKFEVSSQIDDVFNLISDVENYNLWVPSSSMVFLKTTITSSNRTGLGLTFIDKVRFGGKSIGKIVEFIPPERVSIEQRTFYFVPFFSAHFDYRLTYKDDITIVTHSATANTHGIYKPITPVLRQFIVKERTALCDSMVGYFE